MFFSQLDPLELKHQFNKGIGESKAKRNEIL